MRYFSKHLLVACRAPRECLTLPTPSGATRSRLLRRGTRVQIAMADEPKLLRLLARRAEMIQYSWRLGRAPPTAHVILLDLVQCDCERHGTR